MRKCRGWEKLQSSELEGLEEVTQTDRRQRVPVTGEDSWMPSPVASGEIQVKRVPEGLVGKCHSSTYSSFFAVLTVF